MREEHRSELEKIGKVSSVLLPILYLTLFSVAATVLLVTYLTLTSSTSTGEAFFEPTWRLYVTPDQIEAGLLTYKDKQALLSLSAVLTALIVPGLWFAIQLVRCFKRNQLFSSESVSYARRIAWLYLTYIVFSTLASIVLSWTPQGLDLAFNPMFFSREFILLGLIWLFVWMHQIGTALHQESEMTI